MQSYLLELQSCTSEEEIQNFKTCIQLLEQAIGSQPYDKHRIQPICKLIREAWKETCMEETLVECIADILDIEIDLHNEERCSWSLISKHWNTPKHPIFPYLFHFLTESEVDIAMSLIEEQWLSCEPVRFGQLLANLFIDPYEYNATLKPNPTLCSISDQTLMEYLQKRIEMFK